MSNVTKNLLPFSEEIEDVLKLLINDKHFKVSIADLGFCKGVYKYGLKHQCITLKQAKVLGRISKRYIQNGNYVLHNWWDGTVSDMAYKFDRATKAGKPDNNLRARFKKRKEELE